MNCPACGYDPDTDRSTLVRVKGKGQRILDSLEISQEIGGRHTQRILMICIQEKGTAPPKQPLTEAEAEQP